MPWLKNITRCIRWLPIIWKDREWDGLYILKIIEFKLRETQHFMESDKTHILNALKYSQQIKETSDALQRYREDNYCAEWYDILHYYHGEQKLIFAKDGIKFSFPNSSEEKKALEISKKLLKRSIDMRQEDFDFVFDMLKNNLQNWLD